MDAATLTISFEFILSNFDQICIEMHVLLRSFILDAFFAILAFPFKLVQTKLYNSTC